MPEGDYTYTQKHSRAFLQFGGSSPVNSLSQAGVNGSWVRIEGPERPRLGGVDPQQMHTATQIGSYQSVATMIKPPDLHSYSLIFNEKKGGLPRALSYLGAGITTYELIGLCGDLGNFNNWEYGRIYPDGIVTKIKDSDRTTFEDDKGFETTADMVLPRPIYGFGPMVYGSSGLSLTTTPVNDVCYGNLVQDARWGTPNDGTRWIYAVTTGAAAAKPSIIYSTDGGSTWTSTTLTAAANAEVLNLVTVMGTRLIAISKTAGGASTTGYYYMDINQQTGVPDVANATKIGTGFVASKQANDIVVIGGIAYLCGDAGYIYKISDPTSGATVLSAGGTTTVNLLRLEGTDEVLVAVGATSTVIRSFNFATSNVTFAAATTTPVSGAHNLTAVEVINKVLWWVGTGSGTNTGRIYYTLNGGESWSERTFGGNGVGAVNDILFATPECGYVSHSTAAPLARVFGILAAGGERTLSNSTPRVTGFPTFTNANRLAVPYATPDATLLANNLAIAGTGVVAADGFLVTANAAIV
jgi:hypothetical protein